MNCLTKLLLVAAVAAVILPSCSYKEKCAAYNHQPIPVLEADTVSE